MIFNIAVKELRVLFLSPLAWIVMAVTTFGLAWFFLTYLENFFIQLPQLTKMVNPPGLSAMVVGPLFATTAIFLLLISPFITMRLISEERRSNTLPLLTSAPLSITEIVLGKFTGALIFLLVLLSLVCLMPISLYAVSKVDAGILLSSVLGLVLLLASYVAIGIYMSSLTRHPVSAAIATMGVLLMFWILDIAGNGNTSNSVVSYLSMSNHFQLLSRGIFSSSDVFYYLLLTLVFLVLTIRRLDAQRLQN